MECILPHGVIHYTAYGSGVPVVSIHGFSLDGRSMEGCMEPVFAGRDGWRRIYLDLPGMGRSKAAPSVGGSDEILEAVLAFLDRVVGRERFLLVGASYGGYIARGIVAKRREQVAGMALIYPMVVPDREKRDLPPRSVLHRDEALTASLDLGEAADFLEISVVLDAYNWERVKTEMLPGARLADQPVLARIKQRYAFSFDPDDAAPFERPVLILTGRQDHIVGYRDAWRLLERYPRGTYAVLDRAGHTLQIEQPRLFTALMDEWLDRVAEGLAGPEGGSPARRPTN